MKLSDPTVALAECWRAQRWQLASALTVTAVFMVGCGGGKTSTGAVEPKQAAVSTASKDKSAATATQHNPAVAAPATLTGSVVSIDTLHSAPHSTGTGAVVGGVVGGVVGNQIGGGDGKKAATVLGAIGGAVVGNEVEKKRSRTIVGYNVNVKLDNGQTRTIKLNQIGSLQTGARVKIQGETITPV